MIRILHVLGGLDRGGAETMVMNLYRAIDKTKVQFVFITHTNHRQAYTEEIEKLGGKIYYFPKFKGINYFQLKGIWKNFFKDHPEYKILHSHVRSYASLYLPIAKKAGLKTIIHSHSTSNGKGLSSFVKQMMQFPLRYQADYFFGCSKEAGEWLFGKKVVESSKYHILKNAIDTEKYTFNEESRAQYREKLRLGNKLTYVHVGRFHPSKNHTFLLNLFAEIHRRNPNTVLLLVGDGPLHSSIQTQIEELCLQDDVLLLGSRDDIPEILHAADCFLFPSLWEGFGMVAVEAQATGLPCICSDMVPSSVKVTDFCYFISTDDLLAWVDMSMQNTRYALSMQNEENVNGIESFDIKKSAAELQSFYLNV
ncbi:glycosyltransferase family 1 protein [Fibrobacter sp. UWH4]|uniref:glycosyltransferase family 1 protein n=1 Tax=Fibrobacter sp. UWH4 TaxID=1896210 RepID=UPI000917F62F|nr:glycosyltransferase family 1 protein [Fibrobacter sp. UWH4]SHL76011.1 Glycosyltransferase involved in cell wall bisynthesis [Fibrobacter sp. UWH4]